MKTKCENDTPQNLAIQRSETRFKGGKRNISSFQRRQTHFAHSEMLKIYPSKFFACGALDWGGDASLKMYPSNFFACGALERQNLFIFYHFLHFGQIWGVRAPQNSWRKFRAPPSDPPQRKCLEETLARRLPEVKTAYIKNNGLQSDCMRH